MIKIHDDLVDLDRIGHDDRRLDREIRDDLNGCRQGRP
jgi:hypothetical protein